MANFEKVNSSPIIDSFAANPTSGDAPLTVSFACSAHDPNGNITSYMWDFDGDGTIDVVTSSGFATFTYQKAGVYHPIVKVKGNQGVITTSKPLAIDVTSVNKTTAVLSIDNISGSIGSVVNIPIKVSNNDSIVALQFDIKFNTNYLSINNANTPVIAKDILTKAGFTVTSTIVNPGDVMVIVTPPIKTPVPTIPNGVIATLPLRINSYAQEGKETLTFENVNASDVNSNSVKISILPGYLMVKKFIQGDANGDGKISVQDVVAVINDIMIGNNMPYNGSDCNGDGEVNVQDYVCIVNKIMSGGNE